MVGGRMEDAWCVAMKTIYISKLCSVFPLFLSLSLSISYVSLYVRMREEKEFLSLNRECWYFICVHVIIVVFVYAIRVYAVFFLLGYPIDNMPSLLCSSLLLWLIVY
jgi:hypothetical protein